MSVARLQSEMSSEEFGEWMHLYRIEYQEAEAARRKRGG